MAGVVAATEPGSVGTGSVAGDGARDLGRGGGGRRAGDVGGGGVRRVGVVVEQQDPAHDQGKVTTSADRSPTAQAATTGRVAVGLVAGACRQHAWNLQVEGASDGRLSCVDDHSGSVLVDGGVVPERATAAAVRPRYDSIDVRMGEHVVCRADGDDLSTVHGDESIADLGEEREVVVDHEQGWAHVVTQSAHDRCERFDLALGDAGGGLVEQDHRRSMGHEACQVDDSPRAGREFADHVMTVLRETEQLDQLGGATGDLLLGVERAGEMEGGRAPRRGRRSTDSGRPRGSRSPSTRGTSGRSGTTDRDRDSARAGADNSVMSDPWSTIRPPSAAVNPEIRSNNVVLPAPFGPINPTTSRSCSASETSATACTPPKRTWRSDHLEDGIAGGLGRRTV